jgi:ppGpp synthetase/RelA/SpoT-type nucleotidyltranferase
VENIAEQDHVVALVIGAFQSHKSVDRREKPSHGYRAVHVVVQEDGKSVEIQIRTELQHLWASISEEAASTIDQSIKYGGGPAGFHERLEEMSRVVAEAESAGQGRLSLDERRTIAASVADTMGLLMPDLDARRLVREILERTR